MRRSFGIVLSLAACARREAPPVAPAAVELASIESLRDAFNREAGRARVVLLLSPT